MDAGKMGKFKGKINEYRYSSVNLVYFYLLFSILSIVGAIVFWMMPGNSISSSVLDSQHLFSDYFYHTNYAALESEIYLHPDIPVCLPPLAYCLYIVLWRLTPYQYDSDWVVGRNFDNSLLVFVVVNMVIILLLYYLIYRFFKLMDVSIEGTIVFTICIIFSYPCLNTSLQRGNAVLLVAILVGFAFLFMNSNSKIEKEVALILIAIAAGLKTYPALIGIYYLCKGRIKEACRLIIYGAIAFFLPFILFGGFYGILGFFTNVINYASGSFSRWCTIRGYFGMTLKQLGLYEALGDDKLKLIAIGLELGFAALMIAMIVISKKMWKICLYLVSMIVLIPSGNWMYTTIYFLVPFILFLNESVISNEKIKWVYVVLFSIIFCQPFFFDTKIGNVMNWGSVGWIYTCIFILLIISVIDDIIKFLNSKKISKVFI